MRDTKGVLCRALLKKCETLPLEKITVSALLEEAGLSRRTFYNHFKDREDLIRYTYVTFILSQWQEQCVSSGMFEGCVAYYRTMMQFREFVTQALSLRTQNSLMEETGANASDWLFAMYRSLFGEHVPGNIRHAILYNTFAQTGISREWALEGMQISPEEMAEYTFRCMPPAVREIMDRVDEASQQEGGPHGNYSERHY